MSRKVLASMMLVLGIVLLVAGLVVMAIIVPEMKQFPDDVDTVRLYEGVMPVMFRPDTFEFVTDLDIALERHFQTEATEGDIALVKEEQTMTSGGEALQGFVKHYAINRKTMEFSDTYADTWVQKDGFWPRGGLVLGWPIDTEKKDYLGWSDDYRSTVPLTFAGEVEHERAGITTYYFTSESGPQLIHPDAVAVLGLPQGLPKEQFQALVEQTDISPMVKTLLPNLLERIEGDLVPLAYYYEYEGEYWIEPETGVLIDTRKHELRKVGLAEEVLAGSPLANLPEEQRANLRVAVSDFTYWGTDATVVEAKNDAEDARNALQLYGTTLPVAGIIIGLVVVVGGGLAFLRS